MKTEGEVNKNDIHTCYIMLHSLVINIGMFQFGYGMSSWGNLESTFSALNGWNAEEDRFWITTITTISNLGAMTGALSAGSLVKFGKRTCILWLNVNLFVSIMLCLVGNIYLIAVARFFWGFAAGSFSVHCPKFLSEFVPI